MQLNISTKLEFQLTRLREARLKEYDEFVAITVSTNAPA